MKTWFFAAAVIAITAGAASAAAPAAGAPADTAAITADPRGAASDAGQAALDGLLLGRAADRTISPLFAPASLLADHRPDVTGSGDGGAIVIDRKVRETDPLLAGMLAATLFAAGLEMLRRVLQGRHRVRPAAVVDPRFEAHSFVPAGRDRRVSEHPAPVAPRPVPPRAPLFDAADPLREFWADACPAPAPRATSARAYTRIDDAVEVWTPEKIAVARDPATAKRRRKTDLSHADFRFHRLNGDGSVKTAQRRKFSTEIEARKFAETIGQGDAVEVWLADRRLSTVPAAFAA